MDKQLIITSCRECPKKYLDNKYFYCSAAPRGSRIKDQTIIPNWCPLPDQNAALDKRCEALEKWSKLLHESLGVSVCESMGAEDRADRLAVIADVLAVELKNTEDINQRRLNCAILDELCNECGESCPWTLHSEKEPVSCQYCHAQNKGGQCWQCGKPIRR